MAELRSASSTTEVAPTLPEASICTGAPAGAGSVLQSAGPKARVRAAQAGTRLAKPPERLARRRKT